MTEPPPLPKKVTMLDVVQRLGMEEPDVAPFCVWAGLPVDVVIGQGHALTLMEMWRDDKRFAEQFFRTHPAGKQPSTDS